MWQKRKVQESCEETPDAENIYIAFLYTYNKHICEERQRVAVGIHQEQSIVDYKRKPSRKKKAITVSVA